MTMTDQKTPSLLWSAILGLTAIVGSYGFACVFPFAAIAALAAATLPISRGAMLVGAVWAVNQVVGFTFNHYPLDGQAFAWSAFILTGAMAGLGAAKFARGGETALVSLRTLASLAAAIGAYQLTMFVGAFVLDGFESSTPATVAQVALNDCLWFAGLAAIRLMLARSAPRLFAPAAA